MTSAELRRIVGAMTERPFCMCGVGRFASEPCAGCLAKRTIANHADALVALVEAVEGVTKLGTLLRTTVGTAAAEFSVWERMTAALAAVHAIRSEP